MQKMIFVVDDNDINLAVAGGALDAHYRVMTLPSAAKMFALLEKIDPPDLILLDIEMPEMNGFEALCLLKSNSKYMDIPVIFLTSMTDANIEVRGFQLGVVDFITKPFSAPVLLNRIKTHLEIDDIIRERTSQLNNLKNGIVFVLADMVENRDEGTGGHVERTTMYIEILVRAMMANNKYAGDTSFTDTESLITSARLHDVGKIAISDIILNKPGKLTAEEFDKMKHHTIEGERIIDQIVSRTDNVEFLRNAKLYTNAHHERWDGKGYPYGLAGEEIPMQGRIMAIADVYDALISERPYKKAFSHDEACRIIKEGAGTQFDPGIVDIFLSVEKDFSQVEKELAVDDQ